MTAAIVSGQGAPPPLLSLRTLHLFTLWHFAVTVPLCSALMRQEVYLHDERFSWGEIAALLILFMAVLPSACCLADRLVMRVTHRIRGVGRNAVFVMLFGLLWLSLLRPYASAAWIVRSGCSALITFPAAICGAWWAARLYRRTRWFPLWLTAASLGLAIFPGLVVWQFWQFQRMKAFPPDQIAVGNPVPVVVVVFDEFSGTSLMTDELEIDAERFPQFARLAKSSTWYRNATTVHPRTDNAVPAILSGRFPLVERNSLENEHPGNLLQIMYSTYAYDMAVFEPITRLCPESVRKVSRPRRTRLESFALHARTLRAIYPRLILPRDIPCELPRFPPEWFGAYGNSLQMLRDGGEVTEGLFNYSGNEERNSQLRHFLDCVAASERPRFQFLHIVLPHYPWSYFPSGELYEDESRPSPDPLGASGELGEDWQDDPAPILRNEFRYRLQLGYVDRFIGQLLDRLEETGLMEGCLLIVAGDHGVSFRPQHSRRLPDAENLAELLSVPLFIHFPGQTSGRIDDRNVESVDLLPTMAEVLDFKLPQPVDGVSVLQEQRRPRKSLYFQGQMTAVEPHFPQKAAAARRQWALFGDRTLDQPPPGIATRPEWHGRPVDSFKIEARPIPAQFLDPRADGNAVPNEELVPGFVSGRFAASDLPERPAELLVAVDGVIRDSGRSVPCWGNSQGFEFLLPRPTTVQTSGRIEVFLIDRSQGELRLRPVSLP